MTEQQLPCAGSSIIDLIGHLRRIEHAIVRGAPLDGATYDDGMRDGISYVADALNLIVAGKRWELALYFLTARLSR